VSSSLLSRLMVFPPARFSVRIRVAGYGVLGVRGPRSSAAAAPSPPRFSGSGSPPHRSSISGSRVLGVFSEVASGRIRITGPMPLGVDDGPAKLDASTGPFGRILIAIFWWMDDPGAGGLRYREW
jgi:hypothetical protein